MRFTATDINDLPCNTEELCESIRKTFHRNPPRIETNLSKWNILQQDETAFTQFDVTQLSDAVSMDQFNSSIYYILDQGVDQTYGAFIFSRKFKYKHQFNEVLLNMLMGTRTMARFYQRIDFPSAYHTTYFGKVNLGLKHLREVFILFLLGVFVSIILFLLEICYDRKLRL
jgi:hypothetical protein